jgi:hypothetical protein
MPPATSPEGVPEADAKGEQTAEQAEQTAMTQREKPARMSCREAAERMDRLRIQGEAWTSQHEMAKRLGCSSGTINKAIRRTPELQNWAKPQATTAPRAQSLNKVVADRTAQSREPDPEDDAAIREFIERADPQTKAWFLGLARDKQLEVVSDPDKHPRILRRKP